MEIKIRRVIGGNEMWFELTGEEINEVRRQDKIQWAKDVLANYSETVAYYDSIICDDDQLVAFAERLEEKNLEDNGDREIEVIEELFGTISDDGEIKLVALNNELKEFIAKDELIKAIKLHRERTGSSLLEAKNYCEALRSKMREDALDDSDPIVSKVKTLIHEGEMIEAIKLYRAEMGVGLKEAKDYCDAYRDKLKGAATDDFTALDEKLKTLLRAGKTITAVKLYKDSTGEGLRESKDYIDKLRDELGIH